MGTYIGVKLLLPPEMLDRVDTARGQVPRLVWIRDAIEQRIASDAGMLTGQLRQVAVRAPEPTPSKPPPPVNPSARTGGLVQGHPFKAASPGSMRCACGKTMGAH
jgi:hypothetical protein